MAETVRTEWSLTRSAARRAHLAVPGMGVEAGIALGSVLAALLAWWAIAHFRLVSDLFVPSPADVWDAFVEVATQGYRGVPLRTHVYNSLYRVTAGFLLAVLTAVPLGLWMGVSRKVRAAVEPLLEFYRPLPPLAYYTLLVIWLGIDNESKIALLYLAAFPPLAIAAMAGVAAVRRERVWAAQALGAGPWQLFRHVVLPSALPSIFTGMRVSIAVTYTTLVSAELVAARSGVGWMALDASMFLRSDIIFVAVGIMGLTGILLDRLIRLAEARIVPWRGHE